jgi:glutamine synthetase adenylyltransferase
VLIGHGYVIETYMNWESKTYSATNSSDGTRDVLIEHPRHLNDWELDGDLKPAESTPSLYRFKLPVTAHSTAKLEVREQGPEKTQVQLNPYFDQSTYLLDLVKRVPDALDKLKPVIDAETALADLDRRIKESKETEGTASADEARDRENLTALKGNDAAKRFVDELNRAEDLLQSTRKQTADLEQQKKAAVEKLNALISQISFDWDVKAK